MGLHDDLKTALASNFDATQRNRVLAGFLDAYHYTKDDGNGNQVPCQLPGDAALVADKTVDSVIFYMKDIVKASEWKKAREAVPEPGDVQFSGSSVSERKRLLRRADPLSDFGRDQRQEFA